ncbi:MAG: HAMP domain-containing histidine kinase [Planctomycetes bacterium]|nr:HAMP domain-containing histidine kinase [Planctomycetota bacterium]
MKRARRYWLRFAVGVAVALAAFAGLSWELLGIVDRELTSRRAREHQERLAEAIWRLDLWLAPLLGLEAARPADDYSSALLRRSETFELSSDGTVASNRGLTLSPLYRAPSDYFRFHFELVPSAPKNIATPDPPPHLMACTPYAQAGSEGQDYLVSNDLVSEEELHGNGALLEYTGEICSDPTLIPRFEHAEQKTLELLDHASVPNAAPPPDPDETQQVSGYAAWTKRLRQTQQTRRVDPKSNVQWNQSPQPSSVSPPVTPGPLVPLWVEAPDGGGLELTFLRRVPDGESEFRYQGFLVDWPRVRTSLIEQISDLASSAILTPVTDDSALVSEAGRMLATIPCALSIVPRADSLEVSALPRWTLSIAWGALLLALIAIGFGFHAVIRYGDKRSRFASAVTHELRTPLTTFQLYSEMLAEGMVGPEKRQEYLGTLQREARRLAGVVENVLTYARVEEGRSDVRPADLSVADLVDRLRPDLERRTGESGTHLSVILDSDPDASLHVDPEAIAHVVTNLVDNACKYGCSDDGSEVRVRVALDEGLVIRVEDDGPGISPDKRRTIFAPFDRAGRESSNTPGIGLGLSLSRTIAEAMGGGLRYLDRHNGAVFELRVPHEKSR